MKKAVIVTGGKQYLVHEGETLQVELLNTGEPTASFKPLLVIDGQKTSVGTPELGGTVEASVVDADSQTDKVTSIRYKAKKRVHTVRGHRQHKTTIKITSIT